MISTAVIMSALELGCIYALVALALFLSFRILNIADMTTDGAFTLGCAVSATIAVAGHPLLALPAAMAAGACAGFITAFLQTKLKIPSILAGIITNTGLYTVNLAVMGFSSNVSMVKADTMFSLVKPYLGSFYKLIPAAALTVAVGILLTLFLKTRLGLSIRATGDNPDMVRASSINTAFTVTVGPVSYTHLADAAVVAGFVGDRPALDQAGDFEILVKPHRLLCHDVLQSLACPVSYTHL